jgi:hypothetical protein
LITVGLLSTGIPAAGVVALLTGGILAGGFVWLVEEISSASSGSL